MDRADIKMLLDKWWEVYNDSSLNFTELRSKPLGSAIPTAAITNNASASPAA